MAKGAPILPAWTRSIGAAIDAGGRIRASCTRCGKWRDVDLVALAAHVGRTYCLIDRRCRCRMTAACDGWNRFLYLHGVYRPLWSDDAVARWG